MEETVKTRRFSLENDFMNFKTNDLLYGFMRAMSTAIPDTDKNGQVIKTKAGKVKYREYLPIKNFNKEKKLIAGVCGCSTRTIERHLDVLANSGLLDEGIEVVISADGVEYEYPCYWFPYQEDGAYKIIDSEIVRYLVNTRNAQCIRIYLYLLNKYQWKPDYLFTIKEIKEALGYSNSTKTAEALIRDILVSFNREGLINYEKVFEQRQVGGKVVPVEKFKLNYIIQDKDKLPKF